MVEIERVRDAIDEQVDKWTDELPALDALHDQAVTRLVRIGRHLAAQASSGCATDGLVMWQFKTLLALRREGPPYEMSPSGLAKALDLSRGAITTRLTWLEDLGLITREHEIQDRRRVRVRLTDAGHQALEQVADELFQHDAALFTLLTRPEQQQLVDLLRKMTLAIEVTETDAVEPGR